MHDRADPGVTRFIEESSAQDSSVFLSVITVGDLQKGN